LPRIDVLQLHRASVETILSPDVQKAFEYARSLGIKQFGVSVKDIPAAQLAVDDTLFQCIQLPLNSANASMEVVLRAAQAAGKRVLVNRPFSMGALLYDSAGGPVAGNVKQSAFEFILRRPFSGHILTGTKSPAHLRENVAAFHQATASAGVTNA
jgi:aryl-alcohol dehydrogenase-like predicted oxidoreductase